MTASGPCLTHVAVGTGEAVNVWVEVRVREAVAVAVGGSPTGVLRDGEAVAVAVTVSAGAATASPLQALADNPKIKRIRVSFSFIRVGAFYPNLHGRAQGLS